MMHKGWRSIEEEPYCFSRSSIKFQGHTGCKIDDFNPIWVRLQGRSQLSNAQICLVLFLIWHNESLTFITVFIIVLYLTASMQTLYTSAACPIRVWAPLRSRGAVAIQDIHMKLILNSNLAVSLFWTFLLWYLPDLLDHIHVWQVLLQLSCSDTCPIWMWYLTRKQYFYISE